MQAYFTDTGFGARLEELLKTAEEVTLYYLDGKSSKVFEPIQIGRDHLVFQDAPDSTPKIVVLFQQIGRLEIL